MTAYMVTAVEMDGVFSNEGKEGFVLKWSASNLGFGELTFYRTDTGYACDNECMSRTFVKAVLCAWVDKMELSEVWDQKAPAP
jgi:hypothetical protein